MKLKKENEKFIKENSPPTTVDEQDVIIQPILNNVA